MALRQSKLWGTFAGASFLTILASANLASTDWYYAYLSLLGVLSVSLAAQLLDRAGAKLWPIVGVALGLLVGQWWLVQRLINRLFFHFSGFAP